MDMPVKKAARAYLGGFCGALGLILSRLWRDWQSLDEKEGHVKPLFQLFFKRTPKAAPSRQARGAT